MSKTIEKEFARTAFISNVHRMSAEQAQWAAIELYDLMQRQQEIVVNSLKVNLEMGLPPGFEFNQHQHLPPSQPTETTHSVDCLVSVPEAEHHRLMGVLDSNPQLSYEDAIVCGLRMFLERRAGG